MGTYDWMELQTLTNDIAAARARLAAARATKDIGKARGLEEEIARAESQRDRLLAHITTNLVAAPEPPPPTKRGKKDEPAAESTIEPTPPAAAAEAAGRCCRGRGRAGCRRGRAAVGRRGRGHAGRCRVEAEPQPEIEASPPEDPAPDATAQGGEAPPEAPAETSVELTSPDTSAPDTSDRAVATGAAPPAPAPMAAAADGDTNMWDQLKPSDIERAKQDLVTRRAEMLARHAEELRTLDADQGQLDVLEQAITAFLQKFSSPAGGGRRQARRGTRAAADRRLASSRQTDSHSRECRNRGWSARWPWTPAFAGLTD